MSSWNLICWHILDHVGTFVVKFVCGMFIGEYRTDPERNFKRCWPARNGFH